MEKWPQDHYFSQKVLLVGTPSTRTAISRTSSPMVRNIEIPQTHRFIEIKLYHNLQYRGQHDSSYYQPQPTTYNQRQQYFHDRRTQQFPSRNYYDRKKVVRHGNIHSEITSPGIKNTHYFIGKLFLFNK